MRWSIVFLLGALLLLPGCRAWLPTLDPPAGDVASSVADESVRPEPATADAAGADSPLLMTPLWVSATYDDPDFAALRAAAREYFFYRKQAFVQGNVSVLWERYPELKKGVDPAAGVNDEADHVASYRGLGVFDGDVWIDDGQSMQAKVRGNEAEMAVHAAELYLFGDYEVSGGELPITLTLRWEGGRWSVVRTDEVTQSEYDRSRSSPRTSGQTELPSTAPLWERDEAVWKLVVERTRQTIAPILKPRAVPATFTTVRLLDATGGAFSVEYAGPSAWLMIGVGGINPPPVGPDGYQEETLIRGWPATLRVVNQGDSNARVWLWWNEMVGHSSLPGSTGQQLPPTYLVAAQGLAPDVVRQIAGDLGTWKVSPMD